MKVSIKRGVSKILNFLDIGARTLLKTSVINTTIVFGLISFVPNLPSIITTLFTGILITYASLLSITLVLVFAFMVMHGTLELVTKSV